MPDFERDVAPELIRVGHEVRDEFNERFKAAVKAEDPIAYSFELGFGNRPEDIGPQGFDPKAPIKFAFKAPEHVGVVKRYLPFFRDVRSAYEIGVGAGYLLRGLIDVYDMDARGCDVQIKTRGVYREIRKRLGITDRVEEQKVVSHVPIRLPANTEAVICFLPVFDRDWSLDEYQWFHDELRRLRVSTVFWRLNRNEPAVRDYLTSIGGAFPVKEDANRFCIVPLS